MKSKSEAIQRFREGDLATPEDRPISVIIEPGHHVWARGVYRARCLRWSSRIWRWHVWHVMGPVYHGMGKENNLKKAKAACLARLKEVADAKLPGKDLWAQK